jgi:hypothetical protein
MINQEIVTELRRLEKSNGVLIPDELVEEARNPASPLHGEFEWNDTAAAHRFRVLQARTLIKSVRMEVVIEQVEFSIPAYLRNPESSAAKSNYRSIASIRSEADLARAALIDEMKRVANAVSRAKKLARVLGVESDLEIIDTLAASIIAQVQPQAPKGAQ